MMKGITCVADIKQRCFIDPDTGCWLFRLGKTHDGQAKVAAHLDGKRVYTTGARAAWILSGRPLGPKEVVYRTRCSEPACCNPQHSSAGTKAQAGAYLHARGHLRGNPLRVIINRRNKGAANEPYSVFTQHLVRA